MTLTKRILKTFIRGTQFGLAGLATLGMAITFTPTTASAEDWRQYSSGRHHGNVGHNRGFNHNRGFSHKRKFNHHRGFNNRRGYNRHKGFKHHRGFSHNRHRGYNRHRGNGAAVAAGIIGLAAGAIIVSEANRHHNNKRRYNRHHNRSYNTRHNVSYEPWSPGWYRACSRKYRSFNPDTGRYLAYSGNYRFCKI